MRRIFRRSIPPSVRAVENASRRPMLCFVVRDDENKTSGQAAKEEWERMSAEEMFQRTCEYFENKEQEKMRKWCRRAAEQGHTIAQYSFGVMCHFGEGIPQNYVEAVK